MKLSWDSIPSGSFNKKNWNPLSMILINDIKSWKRKKLALAGKSLDLDKFWLKM
jgi:hypothetical protein